MIFQDVATYPSPQLFFSAHLPGSDGPEPLLPGRVPDLQLDGLAVQLDGSDLEVDADGGDVGFGVGVVGEPQQQAGLAHAGVADQEQLEQVVAGGRERKRSEEGERRSEGEKGVFIMIFH